MDLDNKQVWKLDLYIAHRLHVRIESIDVWFEHGNTIPHCHLKRSQTTNKDSI